MFKKKGTQVYIENLTNNPQKLGNGKLHMGIRLVPKSATLNDFERRNGRYCVITLNALAFKANYVKLISAGRNVPPKNLVYDLWQYS